MTDWISELTTDSTPPSRPALDLHLAPDPEHGGAQRFEFTAAGDRVPAWLWSPDAAAAGLVVLQAPVGQSVDAAHADAARGFVDRGWAVLSIDWPLHGARASVKLTERLLEALASPAVDPNGDNLVRHFALQALEDVACGLEAATPLLGADPKSVGIAAVGDAAHLLALLPRKRSDIARVALAPSARAGRHWPTLRKALDGGETTPETLLLVADASADDLPDAGRAVAIEVFDGSLDSVSEPLVTRFAEHLAATG